MSKFSLMERQFKQSVNKLTKIQIKYLLTELQSIIMIDGDNADKCKLMNKIFE